MKDVLVRTTVVETGLIAVSATNADIPMTNNGE